MSRIFITGIAGFVGGHLARHAVERGWSVSGQDLRPAPVTDGFVQADLHDHHALQRILKDTRPDVIFHLAGLIKSAEPEQLYQANVLGTISLFESLLEIGQRPLVILASSSAVYGSGFEGRLISERLKPRPATHYAASKLAQEVLALYYFHIFDFPVMILRMFNLLGPGQSTDLACSAFARQIALAEARGANEIVTGDLSSRRDFVDVRDAARAFVLVAEKGKVGQVYNVCSGHSVSIRKCLDELLALSPLPLDVRVDPCKIQKNDVPVQVGDGTKLKHVAGWRPQISLKQSLSDLLDDWRQRVQSGLERE